MGFLDQLKSQATELASQQTAGQVDLAANAATTEKACNIVAHYMRDLAKHLAVIEPAGPRFSVDGKTPWPAMKLTQFTSDARKKTLRDKDVYDTVSMAWTILPKMGVPVGGAVTLTFLPEIDEVQKVLTQAHVNFDRREQRHPERKSLQSVRFEYTTQAKGNISVKADHDAAQLVFRLAQVSGFGVSTHVIAASKVTTALMDELAKLLVSQPSTFG